MTDSSRYQSGKTPGKRLKGTPGGKVPTVWRRGAVGILTVLVIFTAMAVIYSAYLYRQLFSEQQQLLQSRDQMQVQWGQLLLEQSALAAHSRIEKLVTKKLEMYVPSPSEIVVVKP
jgi:cell division protein FtsL